MCGLVRPPRPRLTSQERAVTAIVLAIILGFTPHELPPGTDDPSADEIANACAKLAGWLGVPAHELMPSYVGDEVAPKLAEKLAAFPRSDETFAALFNELHAFGCGT